MYITTAQLSISLPRLERFNPFFGMSYLAFKKCGLPIGTTMSLNFSQVVGEILFKYYKPSSFYVGFFSPFKTSNTANRWLAERYGSTSLQRITTDSFSDVLLHTKKTSEWGWTKNYVEGLSTHLGGVKVPAFDLAVWLFRDRKWPHDASPNDLVEALFSEFNLRDDEVRQLFDTRIQPIAPSWISQSPMSEADLLDFIGQPPGAPPAEGAALDSLKIIQVGPAAALTYNPGDRLNIITGDNSLGKTFLLDAAWWALTGDWLEGPFLPRTNVPKKQPGIQFAISKSSSRKQSFSVEYNWDKQSWKYPAKREALPGLVIYARYDGSFAVWDPARLSDLNTQDESLARLFFQRKDIWDGLQVKNEYGKDVWLCNGLLQDWVAWQLGGERFDSQYKAFITCLMHLSPSEDEPIRPGEPIRLPRDTRVIPTIDMPYGNVPILEASAGVQRIIALAYILVWSWFEHLQNSIIIRRKPQRRLILIVDEVEAHLHPKWQRVIVPALMRVIHELTSAASPQIHIATHSPLVLASVETVFDASLDDLHHLRLDNNDVVLDELPFIKRGKADLWLISEVFGLIQARSLPAEKAINDAKALQLADKPLSQEVNAVNSRLIQHLASDDDFWPRWHYFATKHGVKD